MKIEKVKLELVRRGPTHNQLLSPLTEYIALCGNHDPEWVRVPFEHYPFLRKHSAFRYHDDDVHLSDEIREMRDALTTMLTDIKSLNCELKGAAVKGADLIELELVLAAAELALLPFELVAPPHGAPRELADRPVVIVRSTRRIPKSVLSWPYRPKMLFCVADFGQGAGQVPVEEHLLALRKSLAPWLSYVDERFIKEIGHYLQVVTNASIERIIAACHDNYFSHVHILAHGGRLRSATDALEQYGLVLHDCAKAGEPNVVGGEQLLGALRGPDGKLPVVITVASCDSGDVGTVLVPGASIAHQLHHGGIPFVVASQFPLSYWGSTIFTDIFYQGLLEAKDPRAAVHDAITALHARAPEGIGNLDWVSVVSYAALPADLPQQIRDAKIRQIRQAMDSLLARVSDHVTPQPRITPQNKVEIFNSVWHGMQMWLNQLVETSQTRHQEEVESFIGSVYKRWAEAVRRYELEADQLPDGADLHSALFRAGQGYRTAYSLGYKPKDIVATLAVSAFSGELKSDVNEQNDSCQAPRFIQEWQAALGTTTLLRQRASASLNLQQCIQDQIELALMAPLLDLQVPQSPVELLRDLLDLGHFNSFELHSLRRQIQRYQLFVEDSRIQECAQNLLNMLDGHSVPKTWPAVVDWSESGKVI